MKIFSTKLLGLNNTRDPRELKDFEVVDINEEKRSDKKQLTPLGLIAIERFDFFNDKRPDRS